MHPKNLQSPSKSQSITVTSIIILAGLLLLAGLLYVLNNHPHTIQNRMTVYCAHDSVYSEPILKQFEKETGIRVNIRFDTEATKSLGLTELLIKEKEAPVCDVFWNNEILGTLDLQSRDILAPYKGEGYDRIPSAFKDPNGNWVGFAARLRVWIINTNLISATPEAIDLMMHAPTLQRVCIAKPLFGTTRTHYTTLWQTMGANALQDWHQNLITRRIVFAQSNGQTKNLVAQGHCTMGWTDTDDFFQAKKANLPVDMLPYRLDKTNQTICIPNTVMMIRHCPNPILAQKLIDYLVSEKIEIQLSQSTARQIPLGPVDDTKLSNDVKRLKTWAADGYPLVELNPSRQDALDWLKSEYLN